MPYDHTLKSMQSTQSKKISSESRVETSCVWLLNPNLISPLASIHSIQCNQNWQRSYEWSFLRSLWPWLWSVWNLAIVQDRVYGLQSSRTILEEPLQVSNVWLVQNLFIFRIPFPDSGHLWRCLETCQDEANPSIGAWTIQCSDAMVATILVKKISIYKIHGALPVSQLQPNQSMNFIPQWSSCRTCWIGPCAWSISKLSPVSNPGTSQQKSPPSGCCLARLLALCPASHPAAHLAQGSQSLCWNMLQLLLKQCCSKILSCLKEDTQHTTLNIWN